MNKSAERIIRAHIINPFAKDADKYDPQGSYTGVPADKYEKPIQDADDL